MQHQPGLHRPELVQRLTYRKSTDEIGPSLHSTRYVRASSYSFFVYINFGLFILDISGFPNNSMILYCWNASNYISIITVLVLLLVFKVYLWDL